VSETRARRRIRQAVEARGYAVKKLTWEPWTAAAEKSGIGGGWMLILDRDWLPNTSSGDDLGALSVDELVAYIDWALKPTEPCECGRTHCPTMPIKGDPQTGLHERACRWFLPYRLPWWPE
jgi:hypothetical protein